VTVEDEAAEEQMLMALLRAIHAGNVPEVEALLSQGADPNRRLYYRATLLSSAVLDGQCEVAECLIRHGADVNAKNKAGITALMLAAMDEAATMARLSTSRLSPGSPAEQHNESFLREVVVVRQHLRDAVLAHRLHGNAIGQTVAFIRPTGIER
jgi:ankyrin repeat protein